MRLLRDNKQQVKGGEQPGSLQIPLRFLIILPLLRATMVDTSLSWDSMPPYVQTSTFPPIWQQFDNSLLPQPTMRTFYTNEDLKDLEEFYESMFAGDSILGPNDALRPHARAFLATFGNYDDSKFTAGAFQHPTMAVQRMS